MIPFINYKTLDNRNYSDKSGHWLLGDGKAGGQVKGKHRIKISEQNTNATLPQLIPVGKTVKKISDH